ncbi:venom acid phosphatase Acph-1-like isoform X4 [Venturia canescens]|uniref:venom acid phosphatase Acph-1-like isoform X4 n=1 Tax=Venturia canescens TaxID=32260 RepID=UPI001C9C4289|nr:venom acid phosphatase Acph-1-like isoform X4 [Venturia canescens]XP_043281259.1 venom acid phosphatase Acph-1-like isoform X4 [Venturia canescens]
MAGNQSGYSSLSDSGLFMRRRYGGYLGDTYSPHKFWLQTSSIDRAKITGSILSAALWKPNGKQAFSPYAHWQPVSLHYWERPEDRLLIIWNACPRLTLERMQVENSTKVRLVNSNNKRLYKELSNRTGLPMNGAADIASLYSTLKAEVSMELSLPEWTKEFFPGRLESIACFSLSMNVFTDNLRKLAGGPLVTKIVKSMIAKSLGKLKPEERKMFVFVGHDSTLVNMLSAMKVWNGQDPDFGCMIMIELHEICGTYYVQESGILFIEDLKRRRVEKLGIRRLNRLLEDANCFCAFGLRWMMKGCLGSVHPEEDWDHPAWSSPRGIYAAYDDD